MVSRSSTTGPVRFPGLKIRISAEYNASITYEYEYLHHRIVGRSRAPGLHWDIAQVRHCVGRCGRVRACTAVDWRLGPGWDWLSLARGAGGGRGGEESSWARTSSACSGIGTDAARRFQSSGRRPRSRWVGPARHRRGPAVRRPHSTKYCSDSSADQRRWSLSASLSASLSDSLSASLYF